ncbi:MAG: 4Fe-4S dicluster domain-containing protein [Candidatus Methanospirareceae archaeon]
MKEVVKEERLEERSWKELEIGAIVKEPGSASSYKTGDWRSERPIRKGGCVKCGLCYIYCPEGAVYLSEEGEFETDLFYCKGCGICANECPRGVIKLVSEVEIEEHS